LEREQRWALNHDSRYKRNLSEWSETAGRKRYSNNLSHTSSRSSTKARELAPRASYIYLGSRVQAFRFSIPDNHRVHVCIVCIRTILQTGLPEYASVIVTSKNVSSHSMTNHISFPHENDSYGERYNQRKILFFFFFIHLFTRLVISSSSLEILLLCILKWGENYKSEQIHYNYYL